MDWLGITGGEIGDGPSSNCGPMGCNGGPIGGPIGGIGTAGLKALIMLALTSSRNCSYFYYYFSKITTNYSIHKNF